MNGLIIGRFQPFHLGHLSAIKFALSKVERLWIGLGSSNKPIQKQNPFSAEERKMMIESSLDKQLLKRVKIFFIPDLDNHQRWIENIDKIVPSFDIVFTNDDLTLYLYQKRGTTVSKIPFTKRDILSGTNIRDKILQGNYWEKLVPDGTLQILNQINAKDRLKIL